MADLERQLNESKAMRDASLRLLSDDLGFLRDGMSDGSLRQRTTSQIGGGSKNFAGSLAHHARDNRGLLGGIVAAIILFLFRKPIMDFALDLYDGMTDSEENSAEPDAADGRSASEETDYAKDIQ